MAERAPRLSPDSSPTARWRDGLVNGAQAHFLASPCSSRGDAAPQLAHAAMTRREPIDSGAVFRTPHTLIGHPSHHGTLWTSTHRRAKPDAARGELRR